MNVIVSNKQKNILDNANIDAIKDLNGLYTVDEIINNFKDYFFSRMIIDATSIVDFAKENVLRKLVSGIGAEKIILFLPQKPEPPQKFIELLISIGIYNYTTNIDEVVRFLKMPNTLEKIRNNDSMDSDELSNNINDNVVVAVDNNVSDISDKTSINNGYENNLIIKDNNNDKKIVVGFKNVTMHAGSTTLIYMVKKHLEKNFNVSVEAFEIGNSDFAYFNDTKMKTINRNNIEDSINNSKANIILIDMNSDNYNALCDDVIYLVEPSILKINKLLSERRDVFLSLQGKKVVLNKSMLSENDVSIFSKEAGVKVYFNLPFVNDRVNSDAINSFIDVMGIVDTGVRGLFGLFK